MSRNKPIGFLLPGQASQYAGLGSELYDNYEVVRNTFTIASLGLDIDIADLCFNGTEEDLSQTANTQPIIYTVSVAAYRAFYEACHGKFKIAGVAGHSLGEYAALYLAGAISFEEGILIVRNRGLAMQEAADLAGETMMAAVIGLSAEQISNICEEPIENDVLNIANYNSPNQIVITGHKRSVMTAGQKVKSLKGKFIPLKVSAPFHCSIMDPVEEKMAKLFKTINFEEPRVPVIKNTDAMPYRGAWEIPQALVYQVTSTVLWDLSVRQLIRLGVKEFYVPCPSKVIVGLMKQINPDIPVYGIDDLASINIALNALRM